jgi:D-beta-D-heptose 7-phosphate kinase/D-beta-D-heptose 1-phosphate adenosyltransferase
MDYQTIIESFRHKKVLVVGEVMLDVYLSGTSKRICSEAPVPVVDVESSLNVPGAAGNTAVNLAALGANVTLLSITGEDSDARTVISLLHQAGVDTRHIIRDPGCHTISKRRIVADGQLLLRYDSEFGTGSSGYERLLIEQLIALYPSVDAILISDYCYGVISPHVLETLRRLMRRNPKPLVVDSKNLLPYRDLQPTAVKPNYQEAIRLLDLDYAPNGQRVQQMLSHGEQLLEMTGAEMVALTIDNEGALIFRHQQPAHHSPAKSVVNPRPAGAGDTYVSVLTLALTTGLTPPEAADLAMAAANIVVNKDGTASCSHQELIDHFKPKKVFETVHELNEHLDADRQQGCKIVFTNGCFDILHLGHITYLSQAKALGDKLIVAVNTDRSVRELKGPERPINPLEERMLVLAALDCVDYVIAFDEDTPVELLQSIEPDVFVKGGDYTEASLPEAPVVRALGGEVVILPYISERSTTRVVEKLRAYGEILCEV